MAKKFVKLRTRNIYFDDKMQTVKIIWKNKNRDKTIKKEQYTYDTPKGRFYIERYR